MFLYYDIIILTETWLSPDISDAELGLYNFTIFKVDRNFNNSFLSRCGGVLITMKSSITYFPITLIKPTVENVFLLRYIDLFSLFIGSKYLYPSNSILVIESYLSTIEQLISNHMPDMALLIGDYNMTCVSWISDDLGLSASVHFVHTSAFKRFGS